MSDVVFRSTPRQAAGWPVGAAAFVIFAASDLLTDGAGTTADMAVLGVDLAIVAVFLLAFRTDLRRGVAMRADGVRVTGWIGTRRLAYEEISHTEVFRKSGTSRLALCLTDGGRAVLHAPRHGWMQSDLRFDEKVAAIEGELGRRTRMNGVTPSSP